MRQTLLHWALALTSLGAGLALAQAPVVAGREAVSPRTTEARRPIDLAICLDTSGSMDGLIESAKRKLWDIVNEMAKAKPTPLLRVALLTYGNDGHPAEQGWVRIDQGFTEDLDAVYQKLFPLTTNGGTELVGRVLQTSLDRLAWTPSRDALKLIFVAGNESADQDANVSFRDACRRAIAAGVQVNPIYCGGTTDGDASGWREIATLADGRFASIDQNRGTVELPTPYDEKLGRLSGELNATYVAFGREGRALAANQAAQDANAATASAPAAAARAESKAGALYRCKWDLVDASKEKDFKLEEVKEAELPEEMKKMTVEQRKAHVAEMERRRVVVQKQIGELTEQRKAFLAEELKKSGLDESNAFDGAVRRAVHEQCEAKGFKF